MTRPVDLAKIRDLNPEVRERLRPGASVCIRSGRYGDVEFTSNGIVTHLDREGIWAEVPRVDRLTGRLDAWAGNFSVGHIGWPIAQERVRKGMTVRVIERYANGSVSLLGRVTRVEDGQIRVGRHVVKLGRVAGRRSLRIGEHRS